MNVGLPTEDNFLALEPELSDTDTAGVIVIAAPYEATSSYGKGSCDGPAAIIDASHQVEFFDATLGFQPVEACGGIATVEAVSIEDCDGAEFSKRLHDAVAPWLAQNKFVITLGGEHSSIVGAVQAHCEQFDDVTVLHFDAHSDLRPSYEDSAWNHACAIARVRDFHQDVVQVGIRSQDADERKLVDSEGIPCFYAHQIYNMQQSGQDWIGAIIGATKSRVYITFDCDVFDPSIIPATGTPEPGGLTWYQIDALFARLFREREVVGMDVNELSPLPEQSVSEFTMAKFINRLIGYKFLK